MKKRKCKQYLKLVMLLFGVTLVLSSCQKDDDYSTLQKENTEEADEFNNDRFSISKVTALEINKNKTLKNKVEGFKEQLLENKIEYNHKMVDFNNNGFSISTDYAMYIENQEGSYHSYTFPVLRNQTEESLENLVVSLQKDGSYKLYLTIYNLNNQEKEDLVKGLYIDLAGKIIVRELDSNNLIDDILNKVTPPEIMVTVTRECCSYSNAAHPDGMQVDGARCPGFSMCTTTYSSGGGGSSSGDSPTSPGNDGGMISGGGSGGGANNDNDDPNEQELPDNPCKENCIEIVTVPVVDEVLPEENPCDKIAELINNQNFIEKIEVLRDSTSLKRETGFSQNTDGNYEQLIPSNNGHSLTLTFGANSNIIGFMHTHLDNFISDDDENGDGVLDETKPIRMFSPRDIQKTLLIAYYSSLPSNSYTQMDAYGVMVSSEGEYMLKFTGDLSEIPTNASLMNLNIKAMEKLMLKFKKKVGKTNLEKRERNFLRFIKDEISINGISLYKLEIDGSINEIKLDANNDRVVIPC